nr:integrase, catalytic region, zinc finger, CCHC-type, peptidase aspartic, catalytic [Tanacetum cinerariifolium]
ELATLRDKSHQENQGELIKHFSKLEVYHLNLQLEYQNLKDSIGNNPPTPDKDTFDFDSVFVIGKMQASLKGKDNAIRQLKKQLSKLQVTSSDTERTAKVRTTDSQLTVVTDPVTNLEAQNDLFRAENDKVKQHYKELYDFIKITRAKHIEQVTKLTAKNEMLKTSVSKAKVQPPVLTRTKHAVDVKLIVPRHRNNRDAHLDYLRHLKESVETICDIVEEAKVLAHTPLIRKKQVTTTKPFDRQDSNKHKHVVTEKTQKTNVPVPHSTGVTSYPKASRSQPKSNPKTNRISPAKGANKMPVEDLPRTNKSHLRTMNRVDSSSRLKHTVINLNLNSICQTCNKCLTSFNHDMCVAVYVKSVGIPHSTRHNCEVERKMKQVWKPKQVEKVWKPTCKVLTTIGHQWRPTGWILYLGKQCPLTRFTPPKVVSAKQNKMADVNAPSGQTPTMALPVRADDQILPHIREDLQITPVNHNQAFAAPPSIDGLIDFVNQLGYPKLVMNLSNVVTNDLFQPLRALLTIINLCLMRKTSGFERPRAPVLQILWGIDTRTNIDYAERIWVEFTQSIHTFIEDKRNLKHRFHPRPDSPLHLSNEEPVLRYLKFSAKGTKSEVFGMPIPDSVTTAKIQQTTYYQEYLAKVTHHRKYLAGETGGIQNPSASKPTQPARKPKAPTRPSISIPVRSAQPAPTSAPAKLKKKKRKQTIITSDKPPKEKKSKHRWVSKKRSRKNEDASKTEEVPMVEPQAADEDADYQKALEESMKDAYALPKGPLPPVVIREPESGKYQPLPEVQGNGKAKVTEERVSKPTRSSRHDESPYALLGQSDNEEESETVVLGAEEGGQDEVHVGPDPDAQAKDQTRSDAGAQAEGQAGSNPDETS